MNEVFPGETEKICLEKIKNFVKIANKIILIDLLTLKTI